MIYFVSTLASPLSPPRSHWSPLQGDVIIYSNAANTCTGLELPEIDGILLQFARIHVALYCTHPVCTHS